MRARCASARCSAPSDNAIETAFRIEFPRLVGGLARRVGDLDLAEELAQEALVEALQQWPPDGTPRNPGAWLMAVAKRRAVDRFRRDRTLAAKYARLGVDPDGGDPATRSTTSTSTVRRSTTTGCG